MSDDFLPKHIQDTIGTDDKKVAEYIDSLRKLMSSPEWQFLDQFYAHHRAILIERIKQNRDPADIDKLSAIDLARSFPLDIAKAIQTMRTAVAGGAEASPRGDGFGFSGSSPQGLT